MKAWKALARYIRSAFWLSIFVTFFASQIQIAIAQTDVTISGNVASRVDPDVSTFVTDKTSVKADGVEYATLTITVLDVNSEPLPGRTVIVTSNRGQVIDNIRCYEGVVLTFSNQSTSDINGRVLCVATSVTPGQATYTAVAEGIELNDKPQVTFTEVVQPPPPPPPPPPPTPEPPPTEPPVIPPTAPEEPTLPKPPSTIQKIVERVGEILDDIPAAVPGGLGVAILIPTVALLVPLGSGISASIMAGLPALQYLLLSSLPSFRPPRKWGTVRDLKTHVPIPGIFVDLVNADTKQMVKRVMTDRTGRFGFLNPANGKYWIEIKNPLYEPYRTDIFDTTALHSEAISLTIYLQALETARIEALHKTARYMKFLAFIQFAQLFFLIGGSLMAIGLFIRTQSTENILLIIMYTLLWVLRFISSLSYSQSGHIVERETDNAVHEAVVQVTSIRKGEQQFVHSTITDESGRFLVLVPPGQYSVIAAKEGYNPAEKNVSGEIQNIEINLERQPEMSDTDTSVPPVDTNPPQVVPIQA